VRRIVAVSLLALGVAVIVDARTSPLQHHHRVVDESQGSHPAGAGTGNVVSGLPAVAARGPTAEWVVRENGRAGTSAWRIEGRQHAGDLEGFANLVSAVQGDSVDLYVSTVATSFRVEAYRMGYYGGAGGRLIWSSAPVTGRRQSSTRFDDATNRIEADWQPSLRLHVDRSWLPGTYLLKLVGSSGQQQYVPLTVRDDASTAAYVVQDSVTTWQAYNLWGGYSLYYGKHGTKSDFAHRSRVVSFDRPYAQGDGSGEFLNNELPLVSLVESLGLDVTYWTDLDLHQHPERLLAHRALLSLGHDEYWSSAMRTGAETARDHGVNLAFLGANAVFRHIRFEGSALGPDRHEVDYKVAHEDPLASTDPAEVTSQWREPPVPRPENALIGELYECNPVKADLVVVDAQAWEFAGTGLTDGEHLHEVVGQEYDHYVPGPHTPAGVQILAHSPVRCHAHASFADMTYYAAPSGAGVFATGTNWWIGKLGPPCADSPCVGEVLTTITANVLAAFGAGPAGLQHPSSSNYAELPHAAHPGTSGTTPTFTARRTSSTVPSRSARVTTTPLPHHGVTSTPPRSR